MYHILQLSDFHIKPSMGEPEKNRVFCEMVEVLQGLHLENLILVYNGDVIDGRTIKNQVEADLNNGIITENKKIEQWNKYAEKSFQLAGKYFSYLFAKLPVSSERSIFCCGNHDVNCYATEGKIIPCKMKDRKGNPIERSYGNDRFSEYEKFLRGLKIPEYSGGKDVYFRNIDGFNFLVVNSNWVNKSASKLCVNCESILSVVQEHEESAKNVKKVMNIWVSHVPMSDFCEGSLYGWPENKNTPGMQEIDKLFGLKLFGDKHTNSIRDSAYIVGAPLDSKQISFGIHEFDEDKTHHYRALSYKEGEWKLSNFDSYITECLNLSRNSIKKQALEYLFGNADVDLTQEILLFDECKAGSRWDNINKMFNASACIQKPQSGRSGEQVRVDDGFINTLTDLIKNSREITVRGNVRVGKSVCLSVLYLNLLHEFACGRMDSFPVYMNIEEISKRTAIRNGRNRQLSQKNIIKNILKEILGILKKSDEEARKNKMDVCCIIDGLNQFNFNPKISLEEELNKVMDGYRKERFKHILYCLDTDNRLNRGQFTYTVQHTRKQAEYIIYFNPIVTYKVYARKKYDNFIQSFCALRGKNKEVIETVKDNIEELQILEIDTNILIMLWDSLCTPGLTAQLHELLEDVLNRQINAGDMDKTAKASFDLFIGKKKYNEIVCKVGITREEFETIRTQILLSKYLLAKYYVDSIKKYKATDGIAALNGVDQLYGHEICSYIRGVVQKENAQMAVIEFAKNNYHLLSYAGKATLSYLIGRLSGTVEKKEILEQQKDVLKKDAVKWSRDEYTELEYIQYRIACRSLKISTILNSEKQQEAVSEYVKELICDPSERAINRKFHLQFYGDRRADQINEKDDVLYDGFDMYCTYHTLGRRIKKWKDGLSDATKQVENPLLELQLFTLCDLIQVRLDCPDAVSKKEPIPSFFYNEKFKDGMSQGIIQFMREMVQAYCGMPQSHEILFGKYLQQQLKRYDETVGKLQDNCLDKEEAYHPCDHYELLKRLKYTKRLGWLVTDTDKRVTDPEISELRKWNSNTDKCLETTLEHTYEMYLLWLLYLPEKSLTAGGIVPEKYDKQEVLKAIMMHDLGEAYTGDSIPSYDGYQKDKEKEDEFCQELYLQGTHSGMADMTGGLRLWNLWKQSGSGDYNVRVAKDLDKVQMLYKLLELMQSAHCVFSDSRIEDFWNSRNALSTKEGKHVFNIVVAQNQKWKKTAERYGLNISEFPIG